MKKKIFSVILVIIFFTLSITKDFNVLAASKKTLTLKMAMQMALTESSDYALLENKRTLTKVQYDQSVKKLKLKEKNQKTFRWTPLLSFDFPEQPDLADAFEYVYKPLELQSEIDKLDHEIKDYVYEIYKKVQLQFIKVYVLQEKIDFNEKRIAGYQKTYEKNRARLILGQANQTDVDTIEKKIETLENTLASDKRNFEAEKEKLSEIIGISDLSTSYRFDNPFTDADLDRQMLPKIIDYTLENDDSYYQAQVDTENALLALNTNYRLMKEQYGSDMSMIDSFINQAKSGKKIDSAAFKLTYNKFLEKVDAPWQGTKKILFIKIPKEWFKGAIDGVRYVEDEPYALYEAAIEYQNLLKEQEALKAEITAEVKANYENYVSTKNACSNMKKSIEDKKDELQKSAIKNTRGELTYEEYFAIQEEYEDYQMDYLDAQASYSEILYGFDRLSCGAITDYLEGNSSLLAIAKGGESFVVADEGEGAYYYIHSLVSDNMFEFGISVTEEFDIDIESYELWVDGVRIGERTGIEYTIRHLALDMKEVGKTFVRLYASDSFIDDCEIDPTQYTGKLNITKGYTIEKEDETLVAGYTIENDDKGLAVLSIIPEPDESMMFYNLKDSYGNYLVSDEKISIKNTFRYLSILQTNIEELTICFYGEAGNLLYEAEFNSSSQTIHKK